MENTERIYGKEIFFNFIEMDYPEIINNAHLIRDIKDGKLAGFVAKGVFSSKEVEEIKAALALIPQNEKRTGPMAELFPLPFITVTDTKENLENYTRKAAMLEGHRSKKAIDMALGRLGNLFAAVGHPYDVKVLSMKMDGKPCASGNFRTLSPNRGGLLLHCEHFFQKNYPFYFQVVEPLIPECQLSYFLLLQNSEVGGELTIYDMLWKDVKEKETEMENEYVLDKTGQRLYLKDVRSFTVKAQEGDIVVFFAGPIWHRVENIEGTKPRITYGGFLNFTEDGKGVRYWS